LKIKGTSAEKRGKRDKRDGKLRRTLSLPYSLRYKGGEVLWKRGRVTPRGFCMDVKTRELREEGFVR
jgi:hypothetical protein